MVRCDPTAGPRGPLDRVAQIADRKYCRPHARSFRLGFPRKVPVFPICSLVNVLHRDDFSSGSNPATEKGEIDPATAAASPDRLTEIRRYRGRAGSSFPFLPRRSALIPSRTLMYGSPWL